MTSSTDSLLTHPKLEQMRSYGFNNLSQMLAAFQTYLDLTEVKQWSSVSVAGCESLKVVTLTAKRLEDDPPLCILPLPISTSLSMESISTFIEALVPHRCHGKQPGHVTVGLVASDSTVTYYRLTSGLSPPSSSTAGKQSKSRT